MSLFITTENEDWESYYREAAARSAAAAERESAILRAYFPYPGCQKRYADKSAIKSGTVGKSVFDADGNLTSFTCFAKLPKELRLMVWEEISRCPRVVRLFNKITKTGRTSPTVYSETPPPVLLSICSEARAFGLLKYKLSFAREQPIGSQRRFLPRVYFNFENDILALDQSSRATISTRFYMLMMISALELSEVRSVLVNDFQLESIHGNLKVFSKLSKLYVTLMTSLEQPKDAQCIPTLRLTESCRFSESHLCMASIFEAKVRSLLAASKIWPEKPDQDTVDYDLEAVIVSHLNERVPYSSIP